MKTLLHVEGLTKTFRTRRSSVAAVADVSFDLQPGRTLALVGESGAGKSTTGRLILRLIEPDSGVVVFEGRDVGALGARQLRALRPRMQMIFQDPYTSLDPRRSIAASVAEPMRLHLDLSRADEDQRVIELLERVGLGAHHAQRVPSQLSGGQLQRVAIARAIALDPFLLVCDEPVSALDPSIRAQIINLLLDLQEEREMSLLFISHDLALVEVIAHDVAIMQRGRIVEQGSVEEIFSKPTTPYAQRLLGAIPGRKVTTW